MDRWQSGDWTKSDGFEDEATFNDGVDDAEIRGSTLRALEEALGVTDLPLGEAAVELGLVPQGCEKGGVALLGRLIVADLDQAAGFKYGFDSAFRDLDVAQRRAVVRDRVQHSVMCDAYRFLTRSAAAHFLARAEAAQDRLDQSQLASHQWTTVRPPGPRAKAGTR